jgi:hypothetical protein
MLGEMIGELKGKGAEYRISVFFKTSSQKLASLNNIIGIGEYSIDEDGNTHEKLWEWK